MLDPAGIEQEIERLDQEAASYRREAIKMTWWMRGGLTYSESMTLSPGERALIGDLVKENLETTKKSGLPFF